MTATCRISHFGVAVSDIDRSYRFYVEALGFEPMTETVNLSAEFQNLSKSGDADFLVRFLVKDGVIIELICDKSKSDLSPPKRDRYGLRHLCLNTDDMDAMLKAMEAHGGKVSWKTRTTLECPDGRTFEAAFGADPDGLPVEVTSATPDFSREFPLLLRAKARPSD
jgi:catechol 2,3-dioxygenase-like lactoylglutathione lyase family enzyme